MAEYIEREALMQFPIRRNHYDRKNGNKHFINGIEWVLEYVENLPAADVVEVVRCKDCKYRSGLNGKAPFMFYICTCAEGLAGEVRENNFCSYGERKEGADNG